MHDIAIQANDAFDKQVLAAQALSNLWIDHMLPANVSQQLCDEISVEATKFALLNIEFRHLVSYTGAVTPSRPEFDDADRSDIVDIRDSDYVPLLNSGM